MSEKQKAFERCARVLTKQAPKLAEEYPVTIAMIWKDGWSACARAMRKAKRKVKR